MPQTVPEGEIQSARALMSISWNLSLVLGPSVATALVLTIGAGEAFIVDALSFVVSALSLLPIRPRERGTAVSGPRETLLQGLRSGFRELAARPWVWVTISCFSVVLMCFFATWQALGPLLVRDVYGHIGLFGVFTALYGIGSVAGSVFASRLRRRRPLRDVLWTAALWPIPAIFVALGAPRGVAGALMCISGFQSGVFIVVWETSLARHIPPAALSRVSSYDWMGSLALLPVGYIAAGPLANAFGVRTVVAVGGALGVVATLATLIPRSTRELTAAPAIAVSAE
jgi:predicted MFS family arabinose efflux permease